MPGEKEFYRQVSGGEGRHAGVQAEVPLAGLFGYVTTMRTLTSGRAEATMQLGHYAPLPAALAEGVLMGSKATKVAG